MKSFLGFVQKAATVLSNSSEYDLFEQANGDKFVTMPNLTYVFNVQAAVDAGRFTHILLELFIERGYATDGKVIVCPANSKIFDLDTLQSDNRMSVIPTMNIDDVKADPTLRALIINAPVEFLTKLAKGNKAKGDN